MSIGYCGRHIFGQVHWLLVAIKPLLQSFTAIIMPNIHRNQRILIAAESYAAVNNVTFVQLKADLPKTAEKTNFSN